MIKTVCVTGLDMLLAGHGWCKGQKEILSAFGKGHNILITRAPNPLLILWPNLKTFHKRGMNTFFWYNILNQVLIWFFCRLNRPVKKGKKNSIISFTLSPLILCCWLAHKCNLYVLKMYDICFMQWECSSASLCEGGNIQSSTTGYQKAIHCRCTFLPKQRLGLGDKKAI